MIFPVVFAGAGPGDPGLITLKAVEALRAASVVLTDYLVHPDCLRHAHQAQVISVGKSRGYHSKTQSDIHALLVTHAQKGERVVRLKGGDPGIFGRLGEELQCMIDHAIPFEVIPGVSSALAAPLYAGIPLTMRDVSRSIAWVTATTVSDNPDHLVVPKADTVVVLMTLHVMQSVCQRLHAVGFSWDTPVAVISNGCTPAQLVRRGSLSTIDALVTAEPVPSPTMMVVGEVVRLSEVFTWFYPSGSDSPFVRLGGQPVS